MLADAVLERIAVRHGMEFSELISLAQWTKEQREKRAKLAASAYFTLVGSLIAAAAAVMWEGLKAWIQK
jgi:hypothetical protein